ncbi:MAG TPA: hypothetical protein VGL64_13320 [Amycolatopsis sp.]|jgi:hypothetical protein
MNEFFLISDTEIPAPAAQFPLPSGAFSSDTLKTSRLVPGLPAGPEKKRKSRRERIPGGS